MASLNSVDNLVKKSSFQGVLKKLWPNFLARNSIVLNVSTLFINMIILSEIIWPGEEFHAAEIGILLGTGIWAIAFSGLIFGFLADKISRKWLLSSTVLGYGVGLMLNGFIPKGEGLLTFNLFLTYNLIRSFFEGGILPVIYSYTNDAAEKHEKSQFFGLLTASALTFQTIGMIISAVFFYNLFWRQFFIIFGIIIIISGFIIALKAYEPKRAATQMELKHILSNNNVEYKYSLTKETIKSTIFAPTNLIAFFEGIFTTILLSVPDYLLIAYLQTDPLNLSNITVSIFLVIFGIPGGIIGSLLFAKLSDRLGQKNITHRINFIILSLLTLFIIYYVIFLLPLPQLTVEQGANFITVFLIPTSLTMGILAFIGRSVVGLYSINQPPVLQAINLPEAQGIIGSSNQFLEAIGGGLGPILGGILLITFNRNFQITVALTMGIGMIGVLLWLFAKKWINQDIERVSNILKKRGIDLSRLENPTN